MQTEELKDLVGKLFIANVKEGVNHLVLGCFYDLGCDIRRCKSEDYNLEKGTGTCCRYYETKCKETIKAFEKYKKIKD